MQIIEDHYKSLKIIKENFDKLLNDGIIDLPTNTKLNSILIKDLLISIASYFGNIICDILKQFSTKNSSSPYLQEFFKNKAINRQYHTYFSWNDSMCINTFLGLFGKDLKKNFTDKINACAELRSSVLDFCFIGSERNKLVHGNYVSKSIELSLNELYDKFINSQKFISVLMEVLDLSA